MADCQPQPEFLIRLRALPGRVPPVIRLRHALKLFKRAYDLVAVSAEEVRTDEHTDRPAAGE